MILLITPSARAQECAVAIELATAQRAQVATTLPEAAGQLRANEYSAVIIDQYLVDSDPDQAEQVLQHIASAIPLYVNCAINSSERIVRELRAALARRRKEGLSARKAAEQVLRSELCEPLTAILLDCELALAIPDLPAAAQEKIHAIKVMAEVITECLDMEPLGKSAVREP
jgi:signal transduction histidine kinase